jgi:hypothetical protein
MTNIKRSTFILLIGMGVSLAGIGGASAAPWDQTHPRRAEVNHRLSHQDRRIDHELRTGKITFRQAAMLHREDHMARRDERFDARFDRSHLTRADQRSLNQDENGISGQIHRDAH